MVGASRLCAGVSPGAPDLDWGGESDVGLLPGEDERLALLAEVDVLVNLLERLDVAGAVDYVRVKGSPGHLLRVFRRYPIYDYVRLRGETDGEEA